MVLAVKAAERISGPRAVVGVRARLVDVTTKAFAPRYQGYFHRMASSAGVKADPGALSMRAAFALAAPALRAAGDTDGLKRILDAQYATMTEAVWTDVVGAQVGTALSFDISARGVDRVMEKTATRVTQITEASQQMIRDRVASEVNSGSNADTLEKSIGDLLRSWGEDGGRSHIIALTESGFAYNYAATEGYRESGLVEMVNVYDGPDCGWTEHDDPDLADGSLRSLDEADEYPLSHPHCQRAFGPVVLSEPTEEAPAPAPASEEPPPEDTTVPVPEEIVAPPIPEPAPPEPMPTVDLDQGRGLSDDIARHLEEHHDAILRGDDPSPIPTGSYLGDYDPPISRLMADWGRVAASEGQSLETTLAQAENILQQTADDLVLSTRRSPDSLIRILREGRFKSQFETGKSGGALSPEYRAAAEQYMFGVPKDQAVEERAIYGYLRDPAKADNARMYGDALMDLKPAVRERTTVVWTDSLGSVEQPSPLTKIRATSYHPSPSAPRMPQLGRTGYPYTEAQMHGGLAADDIARVTFEYPPGPIAEDALEQAGFVKTGGPGTWVWERP